MYKKNILRKQAFTMIELIIVIVVVGILAAVMIPKTDTEPARDAANQLSRHIQYAQHLAMVDDVYKDTDPKWPSYRWGVLIGTSGKYSVQRGKVLNGTLYAKDPLTKEKLDGSSITDLGTKFAVTSITTDCGKGIAFDNFGTPYAFTGSWNDKNSTFGRLTGTKCVISITSNGETAQFTINGETGYVGDVTAP